jgi:endonuclease/exonuclease/phosphatase family metal-dependent hydrolase
VSLSVLTLNLWHDEGPWPRRARLIGEWLDRLRPDLVGLQEVLRGEGVDQARELLAGRGYHVEFARAVDFWKNRALAFGNAAASRWPILERSELALPDAGDGEKRVALSIATRAPAGVLSLTVTHLNWRLHHGAVRERQMVELCDFVLRQRPRGGFPPLLVGDMNAEPDAAEIRYATGLQSIGGRSVHFRDAWRMAGGGGDGITWSNRNEYARPWHEPDRRIDYVFAGPPLPGGIGAIEECRVVCDEPRDGVWPSDHFGVYARLREPGADGTTSVA